MTDLEKELRAALQLLVIPAGETMGGHIRTCPKVRHGSKDRACNLPCTAVRNALHHAGLKEAAEREVEERIRLRDAAEADALAMRRTKETTIAFRSYGEITIPAGLRVKRITEGATLGYYFLDEFPPALFPPGSMILHDAVHYGVVLLPSMVDKVTA